MSILEAFKNIPVSVKRKIHMCVVSCVTTCILKHFSRENDIVIDIFTSQSLGKWYCHRHIYFSESWIWERRLSWFHFSILKTELESRNEMSALELKKWRKFIFIQKTIKMNDIRIFPVNERIYMTVILPTCLFDSEKHHTCSQCTLLPVVLSLYNRYLIQAQFFRNYHVWLSDSSD